MPLLPSPPSGDAAVAWVAEHLHGLYDEPPRASSIRGGQAAADAALAALDLTGYASRRSTVLPVERRGASRLSPYVRHGLLTLPQLWDAASSAPAKDRSKYRDELLWQDYARHLYARLGARTAQNYRVQQPRPAPWPDPWPREMARMAFVRDELAADGWLVNQTRMWVASQWTVRAGRDWREGEDALYRRLLDGSRAANRLGWQWTVGTGSGKAYGFSRWQVEKRAPELCRRCPLRTGCPVQDWPESQTGPRVTPPEGLVDGSTDGGPHAPVTTGEPDGVWLTGESLGARDPALLAHPELPRVFVFDEPLLRRLRLAGMRLVFWPRRSPSSTSRFAAATRCRSWPAGGWRSRTRQCRASPRAPPASTSSTGGPGRGWSGRAAGRCGPTAPGGPRTGSAELVAVAATSVAFDVAAAPGCNRRWCT